MSARLRENPAMENPAFNNATVDKTPGYHGNDENIDIGGVITVAIGSASRRRKNLRCFLHFRNTFFFLPLVCRYRKKHSSIRETPLRNIPARARALPNFHFDHYDYERSDFVIIKEIFISL